MNQNFDLLVNYLNAVKRFPWHALLAALLLSSLGWVFVSLMPNQYEATSRLHLSNESMMGPLLKGLAAESNLAREMASLMRRTLTSRPNLEKVIQSTDIGLQAKTPQEREALLRGLGRSVLVDGDAKSKIYKISYIDENPRIVRDVVQSLTNIFIEDSLSATRKDAFVAQRFLNKEIGEYERKLGEAENRLKDFKQKNIGLMPDSGENYFSKLNQTTSSLQTSQLELQEARKRLDALRTQSVKEKGKRAARLQQDTTSKEISDIKRKLEKLRSQYTDKHPDITFFAQRLKELRVSLRDSDLHKLSPGALPVTPGSRNMDVLLGKAEGEVAALKVRVATHKKQLSSLRDHIEVMPGVEAELAQLNRDYGVIKKTYEGLVQRREAALLSDQAEMSADNLQFWVIEYPVVPVLPIGPNRLKWITLVLLGGIGAGIALSILMAQLRPVVSTTRELKRLTGLPVLGSVSKTWNARQKAGRKRRRIILGAAWALLLLVYTGMIVMQSRNINILEIFNQFTGRSV